MPLRTIPVDTNSLSLVAAGPCEPQMQWGEENGRRVMTDRQETDPESGELLWQAYVMPTGTDRPEVLQVRVRATQQPVVTQFGPVAFDSLEVNVRVGRDGKLAQYWSGWGLRDVGASASGRKNGHSDKAEAVPA